MCFFAPTAAAVVQFDAPVSTGLYSVSPAMRPTCGEALPTIARMNRLRVLIADDDRDEVATLSALLNAEGHQVREIYRGDAVPQHVRDFAPHVVLLDIGMPGMNGYAVAAALREEYGDRCPLLVAVTAWDKGSHRVQGRIAGFSKYVTKPYDPAALLALLGRLASGLASASG